jgi:hypothetical protein
MLGRTVVPRLGSAEALAAARAAGTAPRWLVAESDHYARLGKPDGATEVLRVRRRLGTDLLLLRVEP